MLKSDVCILSSEDIVLELKAKKEILEICPYEFECTMPSEARDVVECFSTGRHCMHVSW